MNYFINYGDIKEYLHDVKKYKITTKEEEIEIIKRIKNGDEKAKELLVCGNLRFVISIAKKYQNLGFELKELISEGNLGLMKAVDKFDYSSENIRFLTYAVWWIRQSIINFLNENSRLIRLPVNIINEISAFKKENFTLEEMSKNAQECLNHTYIDYNNLENLIEENCCNNEEYNIINESLKELTETELFIITKFFGLDGFDSKTLEEISKELALTKERVRQIKNKAVIKIRHFSSEYVEMMIKK